MGVRSWEEAHHFSPRLHPCGRGTFFSQFLGFMIPLIPRTPFRSLGVFAGEIEEFESVRQIVNREFLWLIYS